MGRRLKQLAGISKKGVIIAGRKKKDKKIRKIRVGKNTSPGIQNTVSLPQPDQPDLGHLSGEWQEFYRLVIERIS
jgi:hypothetical protein